jgi:hypothetical protein
VDLERRCGKPFTDSIEADRYALSFESLAHPTIQVRVSAVSVRQSVFNAFFSYLLPQETISQEGSEFWRESDAGVTAGPESLTWHLKPTNRCIRLPFAHLGPPQTLSPCSRTTARFWAILSLIQNSCTLSRSRTSDSRSQASGRGLFGFPIIEALWTHFSNI